MKNNSVGRRVRAASMAFVWCGVLMDLQAAEPTGGSQPVPETVDLEVFQGAQILTRPKSNIYPTKAERDGKEGWVVLNMMIDPHGKPYEVSIVDSIGDPAFEQAAITAVDRISFAPAKRGTTPIDSSFTFKMYFWQNRPASGARSKFVRAYQTLVKAIDAGDKAQADQQLALLDGQNLYEDAFLNYARYFYDIKWGTEAQQLVDLRQAVVGEHDRYLPQQAFVTALEREFWLEMKTNDFGRALKTWRFLDPIAPKDSRDQLLKAVDQVNALRDSDTTFSMSARIDKGTTWNGSLLKHRFGIRVTHGTVSEIKLRCEKQYLFFKYEPGLQYSVSTRSGPCSVELVGAPGTTFELIQS
jgi:TonB family protein